MTATIHGRARMLPETRKMIDDLSGFPCADCGATRSTLCKRQKRNQSWAVQLQCDNCGRSVSNSFALSAHSDWKEYADYDAGRSEVWSAAQRDAELANRERQRAAIREEYANWLATSPDWKHLRSLVRKRSGGICEACLSVPASEVHHITYELGWLPPAWLLRDVCRECHQRFSEEGDDWGPPAPGAIAEQQEPDHG